MEAIPIAVFWSITAWTLFQRKRALLYLFFASMPFGSFAAIPTELTGGLTLTPTPIVALLLIARQLGNLRGLSEALDAALKRSELLLLFLFWMTSAITTAFMPRFFAWAVEIVPVRSDGQADTALLAPSPQNISQFVYVSISVAAVFTFARMLRTAPMRRHAFSALCLGAALTVITGMLDLASRYLPLEALLELFRTATYDLLTDVDILDSKRVVGLMPEASSFGSLALAFLAALYFFRRAMPLRRRHHRFVLVLMALLLALIWLSTSSAAYLGLAILGAAIVAEWCWRAAASDRLPHLRHGLETEFWLGAIALCLVLLVVLAMPRVLNPMREMVDLMVLQKHVSNSYEERTMWTQVSLHSLLGTYGLGVGLGSTRASNFAVALVSNAGLLAAAFYFLFLLQILVVRHAPRHDAQGHALLSAIRWSYLPPFFTSLMIGTTPDFGMFNAFLYGFAVVLTRPGAQAMPWPVRDFRREPRHRAALLLTARRAHGKG